jgi:hypothetical protein
MTPGKNNEIKGNLKLLICEIRGLQAPCKFLGPERILKPYNKMPLFHVQNCCNRRKEFIQVIQFTNTNTAIKI